MNWVLQLQRLKLLGLTRILSNVTFGRRSCKEQRQVQSQLQVLSRNPVAGLLEELFQRFFHHKFGEIKSAFPNL